MTPARLRAATPALVLLALCALATPAHAAAVTLEVRGTNSGQKYWFEVEGHEGLNPTLAFAAGDQVTVHFVNTGQNPHNLRFGAPISQGTPYLAPGEDATLRFTVPGGLKPQRSSYWCDPHRQLGMTGTVLLAGAAEGDGSPSVPRPLASPPLLAPFALAAAVALAGLRRRLRGPPA